MQNSEISEELRAVLETIRIDALPAYGEFEAVLAHAFGDPPAEAPASVMASLHTEAHVLLHSLIPPHLP